MRLFRFWEAHNVKKGGQLMGGGGGLTRSSSINAPLCYCHSISLFGLSRGDAAASNHLGPERL
ncbi:hypothetical protein YC2023_101102 [Brassica napus]